MLKQPSPSGADRGTSDRLQTEEKVWLRIEEVYQYCESAEEQLAEIEAMRNPQLFRKQEENAEAIV